jgi:hypothetical protein
MPAASGEGLMSEAPVEAGVDDVQPVPRRTGRPHFDVIVSLTAIFISAVSLFVAIEHGKTERDLVAANVWPFPRAILSNGYGDEKTTAIGVSNGGVGPAKIQSFEMFYRGHPVSSGLDLLRQCCGLGPAPADVQRQLPEHISTSIVEETVLRPGEENPVLQVKRSAVAPDVHNRVSTVDVLTKVTFRVCYCSVLDQCWIGDLRSTRVQPVAECKPAEHPYDPNGR